MLGTANSFNPPVYYNPSALNPVNFGCGDFDGDGINDLFTINRDSNAASVLTGNADGTFDTPPVTLITTGMTPQAGAAGDFNKDGKLDLAPRHSIARQCRDPDRQWRRDFPKYCSVTGWAALPRRSIKTTSPHGQQPRQWDQCQCN